MLESNKVFGKLPTYPSLSQHLHLLLALGKSLLKGGVGGQFPRNLNCFIISEMFTVVQPRSQVLSLASKGRVEENPGNEVESGIVITV